MLTLLATVVVLSVLILVHEFGHYFAAKSVDIEVIRFSLGMGPKVFGFRRGETEYVLSALPLGGYVKMAGMEEMEMVEGGPEPVDPNPSPRDFDAKPLWARIWVVSAGVIMNFLFAVLVFAGIALFYGERVDPTTRVAVAEPDSLAGFTAPLAAIPFGAQVTAVGDQPIGNWSELQDALFSAPSGTLTLRFAQAPPVTLTLPPADSARLAVLQALQPLHEPVIGTVQPGSAADRGGLQPGDRVLAAANAPVRTWYEFERAIRAHAERPLPLVVLRSGRRIDLTVTPAAERELDLQMRRVEVGKLGVLRELNVVRNPVGPLEAVGRGVSMTWNNSAAIVGLVGDLFTGDASPRSLGGPLAIGQLSGQAARFGAESFLAFMALLSINLAVLNLLPIPVLDGGHLLFLGLEAVRGRPLSLEQRIRLSHVGLILVVGIMIWAMTNDVLRFFGV